jgi:hypothetical protein
MHPLFGQASGLTHDVIGAHELKLTDGVSRLIIPGANLE